MGVLPCQLPSGVTVNSLNLDGSEEFSLTGLNTLKPRSLVPLEIRRVDGMVQTINLIARLDTDIEVSYFEHGGILPYVLRRIMS
jgi:aconitate hydratase